MATSSIFANVHITTPEAAERFVRALELSDHHFIDTVSIPLTSLER